ncbi:MarR family winged helix-turn-helix transcriptional regulator [Rhizobium sp. C1]|uniref:MarR family winged helix-turn-helix transcriptional regulator n=1 Tax=Rhizobium sp. C1 TaxID=1349799 RepID=UPI001E5959A5|nr:MarR family transcriptional regulator [Rhizobium sp. C1]MCD2178241.1 MarR family transcriptional regulator [Rhizobium sp. C1]
MLQTSENTEAKTILDGLRRIVQALRKASSEAGSQQALTAAQIFLLRTLQAHDGASVNDLASLTHTHQSSVSEVVARLEAKGLIDRRPAPADRRRVELRLTEAGQALVARQGRTPQEDMLQAIQTLPAETRAALAHGLSALAAAVSSSGDPPPLFFEGKDVE